MKKGIDGTTTLNGTRNLQCTSPLCTDLFTIRAILKGNTCIFECKKCGCMYTKTSTLFAFKQIITVCLQIVQCKVRKQICLNANNCTPITMQ